MLWKIEPGYVKSQEYCLYALFQYFLQIFINISVPTKPRIIDATDQTNSSFKVKWERPNIPNGVITKYEVFWGHKEKNGSKIIYGDNRLETVVQDLGRF
jgi:hypothetical protein